MTNKKNQIEYHKERENYIPNDVNQKKDPVFKKLNQARMMLFISAIIHLGTSVVFVILLVIGLIFRGKLDFDLNNTQAALAFSYIGACVLVDTLIFLFPAQKSKKKNQFRILAIATLIFATFVLSGSFIFWVVPTLLFYSLITLVLWVVEVIAAIFLILVVEALPN